MKALSIMQPWASLIVGGPLAPGPKRTENRGRVVAVAAIKFVGHRIAIHASKRLDEHGIHALRAGRFGLRPEEVPHDPIAAFPRGAVIGVATLERVFRPGEPLTEDEARFYVGNEPRSDGDTFGLSFGDRRWFKPIECKGALGFWQLPTEVERQVEEQLRIEEDRHG